MAPIIGLTVPDEELMEQIETALGSDYTINKDKDNIEDLLNIENHECEIAIIDASLLNRESLPIMDKFHSKCGNLIIPIGTKEQREATIGQELSSQIYRFIVTPATDASITLAVKSACARHLELLGDTSDSKSQKANDDQLRTSIENESEGNEGNIFAQTSDENFVENQDEEADLGDGELKSGKGKLIGAVASVIVLAAVGGFFLFQPKPEEKPLVLGVNNDSTDTIDFFQAQVPSTTTSTAPDDDSGDTADRDTIRSLLQEADAAYRKSNFLGDNGAIDLYQQVLELDANHILASSGINRAWFRLSEQLQLLIRDERIEEAKVIIQESEGSSQITNVIEDESNKIAAVVNERIEQERLLRPRNNSATYHLDLLKQLNPNHPSVDELSERLNAGIEAQEQQAKQEIQEKAATAKVESTTTDETPKEPSDTQAQSLADFIVEQIKDGSLTTGTGNKAITAYDEFVASNPKSSLRSNIQNQIVDALVQASKSSLKDSNPGRAEQLLATAEKVNSGRDNKNVAEFTNEFTDFKEKQEAYLENIIPINKLEIVSYTPPEYPQRAIRRNIEGFVTIEMTVDRNGGAKDFSILESSPENIFNASAMETAVLVKFKPYQEDDYFYERRTRMKIRYQLNQ
jgi:TonB family protein